ncbi:MAG: hypothetical protein WDZ35_06110 [Crocinitomicaceae bacterium]
MDKRRTYQLSLWLVISLVAVACRKSEVNTNRLSKQGEWQVTELTVGTNVHSALPRWDIGEAPDDKEFATAIWKHSTGSTAPFLWRFNYYEGTFSFLIDPHEASDETSKAYIQCDNLSGEYNILTDKRKLFEFESIETKGYGTVTVFIRLEPY